MAMIGAAMAAPLAPKRSSPVVKYQYKPLQYQYQYQYQPIQQTQPIQLVDSVIYQDYIPTNTQLLIQDKTIPVVDDLVIQDYPVVDLILS